MGGGYSQAIPLCDEALRFCEANSYFGVNQRIAEFNIQKALCARYVRNYGLARDAINAASQVLIRGSNNWFVLQEDRALLEMHELNWNAAREIHILVTDHPRFESLSKYTRDKWALMKLFIDYGLHVSNKIGRTKSKIGLKLPELTTDKAGFNVWILIIEILYLMRHHQEAEVVKRVDALKTYRSRYLTGAATTGGATLLKLIAQMDKHNFDLVKMTELTKANEMRLSGQLPNRTQLDDSLLMPYDWIWNEIMQSLRENSENTK